MDLVYAGDDFLACLLNRAQVFIEAQSEHPHAEIEYGPYREDDSRNNIEPSTFERSRMGLHCDDGVEVQR